MVISRWNGGGRSRRNRPASYSTRGGVGRNDRRRGATAWAAGVAIALACQQPIALACQQPPLPHAQPAWDPGRLPIEWRVPEAQLHKVKRHLDFHGDTTPGPIDDRSRGLPLFYILVGLASLPSIVDAIVATYRDMFLSGIIIDACGEKLEIRNDPTLPVAVVVVRCRQNVEIYRSGDVKSPDLLKAIVEAGAKK
jgi:hypothetical protein